MRKKVYVPEEGDLRIVEVFPLLPKQIGNTVVWGEKARVLQRYDEHYVDQGVVVSGWCDVRFLEEGEEPWEFG
jgi:hypothetical protein